MAKPSRENQSGAPPGKQINGVKKRNVDSRDPYNEYQNFLYNRALFGLSTYSKEEMDDMNWDKKKRIIKVHKRAQTIINLWKQQIVITLSNHLFKTIFPDSPITKELLEIKDATDELFNNKMSFKSLKITKTQVILRFIEEGILPKNFNQLIPKQDACRISSKRVSNISDKSREPFGGRIPQSVSKTR